MTLFFLFFIENHRLESSHQNHLILKVLVVSMNDTYVLFKITVCIVK